MEAIDIFYPERMAERILGMGDVVSLVERAQEQYDEEEARKIQKKIAKNEFGFDDFLSQIQQVKKMGNMKDLVGMIPGATKAMKDVEIEDDGVITFTLPTLDIFGDGTPNANTPITLNVAGYYGYFESEPGQFFTYE